MLQLPMMGTIHSMLKTQQLTMKWQQRKENPKMEKADSPKERQIAQFRENAENIRKSNVISTIDGKLKSGQNISDDELEYLRINCPELYKKAIEVAMEREQYRKELEGCKTKEDVERVNANKMQRFLSETGSIRSNANIPFGKKVALLEQITRRLMGVKDEHAAFTRTPEYAALPREMELEDEKAKKKEKPVVEIEEDSDANKLHLKQKPEQNEPTAESTESAGPQRAAAPNNPSESSTTEPHNGAKTASAPTKPDIGAKYAVGTHAGAHGSTKASTGSPPTPQTTGTAKKPASISVRA